MVLRRRGKTQRIIIYRESFTHNFFFISPAPQISSSDISLSNEGGIRELFVFFIHHFVKGNYVRLNQ